MDVPVCCKYLYRVFRNIYSMYLHLLFSRFSRKCITGHWQGYIGWRAVTTTQCQSRLYPLIRDTQFGLCRQQTFHGIWLCIGSAYLNSGKISLFHKQSWNSISLCNFNTTFTFSLNQLSHRCPVTVQSYLIC